MPSAPSLLPTHSTNSGASASASATASSSRPSRPGRRTFGIGRMFYFRLPPRLTDAIVTGFTCLMDGTVYILGPILIGFALVIASGLSYSFFYVVLPMMQRAYSKSPYLHLILACHVAYVVLVLSNVLYNYFLCVVTSNKGANYERVVRELADATDFWYPDTPSEVRDYEQEYREKMLLRMERRQARAREAEANTINNNSNAVSSSTNDNNNNNNNMTHRKTAATANSNNTNTSETSSTTAPRPRVWTLMGPYEWGFCSYSKQPKPPRSHYDHVTKTLVLNMDHYCPWMFNTIGYFNYRYFCNFLFFVFIGMFYGAILTFTPFQESNSHNYFKQKQHARRHHLDEEEAQHLYPWTPLPDEKTAIGFSFILCLSVGIAVLCLLGFHIYLLFTAQTTIEFHANVAHRRRAKRLRRQWINPYDFGWKRNWQQVYGTGNPVLALFVPSSREPEFLPVPFAGDRGRRHPKEEHADLLNENERRRNSGANVV